VSGGAINAALLSSFAPGDELSAVDRMQEFWINAANTPLYDDWIGGVVEGMFFKAGLYDSKPLKKFLKSEFSGVKSL